ncbi:MAG: phenylalanine--tRNA ligase subunit beta [Candidatus Omnitrophica bacterium CG1_02_44_16]|nr:MAG: phenylalanine--tRNA ligase subunit beta [Candidatus Omnitrophica bacterium CG1_02_44_16]PIY82710.1 MAG: phenylalanine--tRNA ligase subunit beta [Candidatus Omnitrophica bacterium CG_4_10_14_0_8_um_filter_44_12]PIZ84870.1 MAG: phenylalanine--tRNA ligase subunit beta [Candidatus Omnitrophica bacterium CG_4_10_14_0_2_um_filter_44_9]
MEFMKISYSWIKEFVDVKLSPEKLGDRLTMAGLSVASLEEIDGDWVYDIEVMSNRPDWLSARGIAREVAAITNTKFANSRVCEFTGVKKKKINRTTGKRPDNRLTVSVEDTKACPLYYGNLITGVKAAESPAWLIKRLNSVGLRSVNNVVDITNLCLMEYGQPLHAFDFDKLEGGAIIVRRARDGERLILLDGIEKRLSAGLLVIADKKKPVAIAGIMGGQASEVTSKTVNIMLESACFDPVVIRQGARTIGVVSDSSYRFERSVDIPGVRAGLLAATRMICDMCGGTLVVSRQSGMPAQPKKQKIMFDLKEAVDVLSIRVTSREAKNILKRLGFVVKDKKQDVFEVTAPSFRKDVKVAEDLTEEIARSYGYDKIPLTTPEIRPFSMEVSKDQAIERVSRELLVAMGFKEVITYSLTSEENYAKSAIQVPPGINALVNPLSQDYHLLRTTLLPALFECASFNINRNDPNFEIFEIAHIFGEAEETISVGILLSGDKRAEWLKDYRPYTLYDLKGALESLFDELRVKGYVFVKPQPAGASIFCIFINGQMAGSIGVMSEAVKKRWGIKVKKDIFVAEVSLSALARVADLKKVFTPIASTPSISRDISVLTGDVTPYAAIKELIEKRAAGYLKAIALSECYQGKEVPRGSRGLTISLTYGSDTKTLTDAEINLVHSNVLEGLVKELSLTLR